MISFIKAILTPPVFNDEFENQQAYMLHIILWTLLIIPIPYLIFSIFAASDNMTRVYIQVGFGEIINIILLIMLRRGLVNTASIIQVSAFWLFFTVTALTGSGVQGEAYLIGSAMVITFAGILLGGKGAAVYAVLSFAAGAYMVYQQAKGNIGASFQSSPLTTWFVSVILFSVGAVLQHLAFRKTRIALAGARASEERYRLISQISSDYTFSTTLANDGSMHLNWVAGAFEKITGYTYEEYVASGGWLAHIHPDDTEQDARDMEAISQNKRVITEVRTITKNRELRWVRVYGHPVWDEKQNRLTGIVGAVQDITEHKKIANREASHQASLERILELGKHVTESKDLQTTYKRIWHAVRHDLGFDRLGIYLYDPESNSMLGTFGTNNHGEMIDESKDRKILDNDSLETNTFIKVLKEEDGYYFTHQYDVDHNIKENPIMVGVKDYAAVAAWAGDKPVAVLCVDNAISQQPIKDEQLESLRLFAGFAGLAIENSRLNDALQYELAQQKQLEEKELSRRLMLEKVVRLGKLVTEVADLRTTLKRIWHGVREDLDFDRVAIFLYNPERKSMDDTFGTNLRGEIVDEWDIWFPVTEAARFMRVLERPDGLYFTHNYDVENNISRDDEMSGVKDYAAVAVWAGEKPVAVICVDHVITNRRITEQQLEALRLFAGYAGLAIENSRLNDALQRELLQQKATEEIEASRRIMLENVVLLGQKVTEVNDLRTTIEKIWHGVHDEIGFDRLAIFLYDEETNTVNGTLGTDNDGNIIDEWDYQRTLDSEKPNSFMRALEQPNGLFFTNHFATEFDIPKGHEMYNVKDFAAVSAWAGDKPVAIITADNDPSGRPITITQLEALRLFGGYAGLAIENSRLNEALQSELEQRKSFIDELETKNAELERFTYTVSHDLKSPLVTITGFLGYLEQDATTGNVERVKSGIDRISRAAKKMQKLLNDLLELSRIGRIMNSPEDIPFEEIVNEAIDHVRGQLNELDALIESQAKYPVVHGDRIRLVEVVQNLIDNALKYSNPNTKPRIEIGTSGKDKKGYVIIHVRDNGIGIEEQYYDNIFGLFNKLDAQSDGTGIGLSLVKRIIEVHNGRIWVESEKGKGAVFYFSLPTPQIKE